MTREEAFIKLWDNKSINSLSKIEFDWILKEVFNHFEQRITELEKDLHYKDMYISTLESPKTCEGCKYYMSNHSFRIGHSDYLNGCKVLITPSDFSCSDYEPKPSP